MIINRSFYNICTSVHIKTITIVSILFFALTTLKAQTFHGGKKISPDLFGLFFEDINYSADGGLYAELVQNRSFEYNPTERREWHNLSYWEYISPGYSYGRISVETKTPVHPNNPHYIVLDIEHVGNYDQFKGEAVVGLKNSGFDGIVLRNGEKYNFSLFANLISDAPVELLVSLENRKGEVIAKSTVMIPFGKWLKYATDLTAVADCDSAFLVVLAKNTGKLAIDMVSLFPENTFKNRPNGLRADLAQILAEMKPKFVRFPGGCLVHGDGLGNMYRWKNTIGPVEERKSQRNIWGYHQTTGLGFYEYFLFCEDIGAKPIPILPAAVCCQNSGGTWRIGGVGQKAMPTDELPEYIQEIIDLIEWANGPVTSTWGAKRAAAGHPEPFNLKYIGIGNEDKITPEFEERFKMIYQVIMAIHPEIKVIGTSGPFHSGEDYEKGWAFAKKLGIPVIDEHYYVQPEWLIANQHRYDSYNRKESKVYLGEYASWGNKLQNAIAEAAYLTGLERNGDVVVMASYAPLLAKKGFTQWKTDLIFFDNISICPTPNYYVQKMFMTNKGDYYFDKVITKNEKDSALAASCVMDMETGDVIVKLVNAGNEPKNMKVDLSRFKKLVTDAEKIILTGNAGDENTFEKPDHVVPVKSTFKISNTFEYNAPAMSLTIIRIRTMR